MKMKKICMMMAVAMTILLVGCGGKEDIAEVQTSLDVQPSSEVEPSIEAESVVVPETNVDTAESSSEEKPVKVQIPPAYTVDSISIPKDYETLEISQGVWEGCYIWNFDDDITRGVVDNDNLRFGSEEILDFEAYYGTKAYTDGSDIYLSAYNHRGNHPITYAYIQRFDGVPSTVELDYDRYLKINTSAVTNGLYAFVVEFDAMSVPLYFYVNDGIPYCVRLVDSDFYVNRYQKVNEYIASCNFTPDMALKIDDIQYPTWDGANNRNDTHLWIQLSHDLLDAHPDWSDEMKVWCVSEWILNNIKYDEWRYKNGSSRAMEYKVWDGTYSMWDLKVGVCCDFVNAMAIMLREQGIPTSSLNNAGHTWNIVYLDGMWHEIDITSIMPYHSYEFDASDCVNKKFYYCEYMTGMNSDYGYEEYGIGNDIYDSKFWGK